MLAVLSLARATAAVLEWDPSPDPGVAGYKVYIGTESRAYSRVVDVGFTNRYQLSGIEPGRAHYLAATAYSIDGMESDFSEEVVYARSIDGTNVFFTPVAVSVPAGGAMPEVRFASSASHEYFVQTSTNLLVWETAATLPPSEGSAAWRDNEAANHPIRFYRVIAARW